MKDFGHYANSCAKLGETGRLISEISDILKNDQSIETLKTASRLLKISYKNCINRFLGAAYENALDNRVTNSSYYLHDARLDANELGILNRLGLEIKALPLTLYLACTKKSRKTQKENNLL